LHLGHIEVRYLDGGAFGLDGGAMFGVVPKVLWEKKSPPDEKNRIRMRANSLLVRAHNKTILIETGNGTNGTRNNAPSTLFRKATRFSRRYTAPEFSPTTSISSSTLTCILIMLAATRA